MFQVQLAHDAGATTRSAQLRVHEIVHQFNSSTIRMPRHKVIQALGHFSYEETAGRLLLCDEGSDSSDSDTIRLTEPVIHSRKRLYGPSDLGEAGVRLMTYSTLPSDILTNKAVSIA